MRFTNLSVAFRKTWKARQQKTTFSISDWPLLFLRFVRFDYDSIFHRLLYKMCLRLLQSVWPAILF